MKFDYKRYPRGQRITLEHLRQYGDNSVILLVPQYQDLRSALIFTSSDLRGSSPDLEGDWFIFEFKNEPSEHETKTPEQLKEELKKDLIKVTEGGSLGSQFFQVSLILDLYRSEEGGIIAQPG